MLYVDELYIHIYPLPIRQYLIVIDDKRIPTDHSDSIVVGSYSWKILLFLVSILNMLLYIHFYTHYLVFSYSITCWLSVGTCLQIQITEQMSESDENCNNGITLDYLQSFYSFSHFSWTDALHRYLNCNLLTRNIISIFHNSIASE